MTMTTADSPGDLTWRDRPFIKTGVMDAFVFLTCVQCVFRMNCRHVRSTNDATYICNNFSPTAEIRAHAKSVSQRLPSLGGQLALHELCFDEDTP